MALFADAVGVREAVEVAHADVAALRGDGISRPRPSAPLRGRHLWKLRKPAGLSATAAEAGWHLDLAATRALTGSGDDMLLVVRNDFGDDLARDDGCFSAEIERGAPTAFEALHAVVHGGLFSEDQAHPFQYGYA
ncbi:hypothetical protein [Streptomyces sp. NBC_00212]|uniref:DUF7691 family protein n=1 Tax=Streptomyces sp. NBC_00212 TaxID=2975684 RepID=UPI00324920F6